ncbi:MAG TPA: hypothetical protein VKH19_12620 [Gemmatimonadaceae bacterium]|nr:hypothetical protein [Gemmatimonadaceae bacterium]
MSTRMFYRYAVRACLACGSLLGVCVGCDRPPARAAASAHETTAVVSEPRDTIVRRVVRRTRHASAMQRVTQGLHARRALAPLDSLLVVRVYDQRGVELAGVPVAWTLATAGEGAELRVVDSRTDSLGLARASFAPGASADSQHVMATVDSVGRIDFGVLVQSTSVSVRISADEIWSGDETAAVAELRDSTGRELSGGEVSWGSKDSSIVRVHGTAPGRAAITGVAAGETAIVAWLAAGKPQGSARVSVRPVINGRVVTLDGRVPPPMRVEVRSDRLREQLLPVAGAFTARIPFDYEAAVELIGTPGDSTSYHAFDVRVHDQRDVENLRIALVPTSWRIETGTYAGREVAIDANRAMQRTGRGAAFWRLVPLSGTAPRRLLGWADADLPLHIAFNRARSVEPVTAADSGAFWNAARQMERDLGMRLWEPAGMGDSARLAIVPVEIGVQGAEGHTFLASAAEGNANDGVVLFRHSTTLHDAHVVTHELLHLIGFGHTNAWPTVSVPAGGSEPRLTPEDVAYVQLAYRLRRLQRETGARPGLPVAAP